MLKIGCNGLLMFVFLCVLTIVALEGKGWKRAVMDICMVHGWLILVIDFENGCFCVVLSFTLKTNRVLYLCLF